MKAVEIKRTFITLETTLGRVIRKKLRGLNKNPYFIYGIFEEKYFVNLETLEISKANNGESELKTFRFNVEYEHKGMNRGWNQKDVTVKAKNYDLALQKVYKQFKRIYEISEL